MGLRVGVVGATGVVGRSMLRVLEERGLLVDELRPMSSARSAGTQLRYKGEEGPVIEATPDTFSGLDVVLFSAGSAARTHLAPPAVAAGAGLVPHSAPRAPAPGP